MKFETITQAVGWMYNNPGKYIIFETKNRVDHPSCKRGEKFKAYVSPANLAIIVEVPNDVNRQFTPEQFTTIYERGEVYRVEYREFRVFQ